MKKHFLTAIFTIGFTFVQAQINVVFEENFETDPLTNVVRTYDLSTLTNGETPCSEAGIGTAIELNSGNVDFQSDSNSTHFLAVNPEDPCGGYYKDEVKLLSNVDLTSQTEQIRLEFDYFISNTLNWGQPELTLKVGNSVETITIDTTELNTRNQWDNFSIDLPSGLNHSDITIIEIELGGGSGVGLDNLRFVYGEEIISDPLSTDLFNKNDNIVYPNPTQGLINWEGGFDNLTIIDYSGKKIEQHHVNNQNQLNLSHLSNGIYFIKLESNQTKNTLRIVVNQ